MWKKIDKLIEETLVGLWPTDITDQVFCAIEDDSERLRVYSKVVKNLNAAGKNGEYIVNQHIGKLVRQLTTGVNKGRCNNPRSGLIKSYERH